MSDLLVHGGTGLDGVPVDVLIQDGRISAVGPGLAGRTSTRGLDAGGAVVVPAFVESHLHLDKALLGATDGGLDAAIAATAERKRSFTTEDVASRADRVMGWALAAGTTQIRAHTEIDPTVGDLSIRALLALRERWRGRVRLQLAAFPQEGIEARPGTLGLLVDALDHPDVIVGGCPYAEGDARAARRHIDTVLDLAAERDLPADLHLDLADHLEDDRFVLAEQVAHGVIDRGLEGRVSIGHVTTLGLMDPPARTRIIDALAEARVTVAALPATDLFLTQRSGRHHSHRGIAPVRELHGAGVDVVLSSNNVRNAFTPTGRADPLDIGLLFARLAHVSSGADVRWIVEMLSSAGQRLMDPDAPAGLTAGAPGDIVLLRGVDPADVLSAHPAARVVIRAGDVVARTETTTWVADAVPTLSR
ncbi:MAG: amidohydrolase family protein [Microbacterium sp.]